MIRSKIYKTAVIALSIAAFFLAWRNYREYLYIREAGNALEVFCKQDGGEAGISTSQLVQKLTEYDGMSIISIDSKNEIQWSVKVEYSGTMEKAMSILNEVSVLKGVISVKNINHTTVNNASKISAEIYYLSNIICK